MTPLIPISGLESFPIPPTTRALLCSPEDHHILACFSWRFIVPHQGRFLANPQVEQLVVQSTKNGWVFYPHHLVLAAAAGFDLLPLLDNPQELYALLNPIRFGGARTTPINRLRWDVRRENLRVTPDLPPRAVGRVTPDLSPSIETVLPPPTTPLPDEGIDFNSFFQKGQ